MTAPEAAASDNTYYELRLSVAGQSPRCVRALENLRQIRDEPLFGRYRMEVVDLLVRPQRVRGDEIVAAPTVVCALPGPIHRIGGDFSDTEQVLVGLQLRPDPRSR